MACPIYEVSGDTVRYLRKRLLSWGRGNYSPFPWRDESNQFHALVAEVLLQRTRAEQVVPVYQEFKKRFPDPKALAEAGITDVQRVIAPLGLKWRAKFVLELGRKLQGVGGLVPPDIEFLKESPGVGPYAAAAYLSLHTGKCVPIVDSNVVRFYGRFFGFSTGAETRRKKGLLKLAEQLTPKRKFRNFNYALIDFTRTICKLKPRHEICPVADKCSFISQSHQLVSNSQG